MAQSKDHLEESGIQEEEVHQGDQGQSNSSEGQDRDVVVEGAEESDPTSVEATGLLRSQEAEPSMEVDVDDIPPLTSGDVTTVTPEEDKCSWVTPPQCLARWPGYRSHLLTAISLRMVKPHSRSCPPQHVSEALHMSPPPHLRRRKKTLMSGSGKKSRVRCGGRTKLYLCIIIHVVVMGEDRFVCP